MISGVSPVRALPFARLQASHPLSVAIIGNDMLLAALPATPVQLAHACYQLGYQIVVPASWGDELVAHAVLEDLRQRDRDPVIQCTCPFVAERLLASGQHLISSMVQTASPPVAAAKYARHAFSPRTVRITYVGACPGARHATIDQRYQPDEFLQVLLDQDIVVTDMPTVFDSVLPPDRRRFVSLPGGCPTQEALWQNTEGRMLREVTQPTFSADLAQTLVWREHVMIDVAPSLGCACAGGYSRAGVRCGRVAVMAVEPPRAAHPVVAFQSEFVAPTEEAVPGGESTNGDAPVGQSATLADSADTASAGRGADPAQDVSQMGPRDRSDVALPRAYMAKRRHLGPAARRRIPGALVERVKPPLDTGADDATELLQPEPNESTDIALPIAVHVEPEQGVTQEEAPEATSRGEQFSSPALSSTTIHELPFAAAVLSRDALATEEPLSPPQLRGEPELASEPQAELVATIDDVSVREPGASEAARELEMWGPPPRSDDAIETPALGPLRVEVEILEEPELPYAESVISDAQPIDALAPADTAPEVAQLPVRGWGDFVIATWLVLVASAVIAALLWRR